MTKPMSLKAAKLIAGRVGARIASHGEDFEVLIAGRALVDPVTGETECLTFYAPTPRAAAACAMIETGRHCNRVIETAKRVYVQEDLLFATGDE